MSVETLNVANINFHVYYECEVQTDPYATGDSPTKYNIEIIAIEVGDDTQDVTDILPRNIWDQIMDQLIQIEAN